MPDLICWACPWASLQPILVAFVNPDTGRPDFRLKLVAQYHVHGPGAGTAGVGSNEDVCEAWRYARACSRQASEFVYTLPYQIKH